MTPDIYLSDQGSVVGFTPVTDAGKDWIAENLETEDWQWAGVTLWVDHRPASHIILGIINDTDLILN